MNVQKSLKKTLALSLAVFLLSACQTPKAPEPSATVIRQFQEATRTIHAADVTVKAALGGGADKGNVDLSIDVAAKVDQREGTERKADLKLKIDGSINAPATEGFPAKTMTGGVEAEIRTLGDRFYFNLAKLEANDPSMAPYKAIIDSYRGKWLTLAKEFTDLLPESLKQFKETDEKAVEREKKMKDLFVKSSLFDVAKEFGVESLGGKSVYHYGIRLNEQGIKDYVRQASVINGRQLSDAEVDQATAFLKGVKNLEMWIGMEDHYLYKGTISLSGGGLNGDPASTLELTYNANSYNQDLSIVAPENAEEFNPMSLVVRFEMMGPAETKPASDTAIPAPSGMVPPKPGK